MEAIVVKSDQLNFPEKIARKLNGKEVELIETKRRYFIKTQNRPYKRCERFFEGIPFSTERYLEKVRGSNLYR